MSTWELLASVLVLAGIWDALVDGMTLLADTESHVLSRLLYLMAFGFAMKSLTFAFLRWTLSRTPGDSRVDRALKGHYTSLAAQGIALVPLFTYYGTVVTGEEGWLGERARISLYTVDALMVAWAVVAGVRLCYAWIAWRVELSGQAMERPREAIVYSPAGSRWRVEVSDTGVLSATLV